MITKILFVIVFLWLIYLHLAVYKLQDKIEDEEEH